MKIEELQKRTIVLLEKTKKHADKFIIERKKLDQYLRDYENVNLKEWEKYIEYFEKTIQIE